MSITSSTIGKRTFKIVLLGDSATGKTSVIERFVSNKFEHKDNPTIGIDFVGKNITYKNASCRLQLWDTAGQERYRSLIPSYLKDAICAIFVFDVSRPETLENLEIWIDLFRQNRAQKTVMIACANKIDLPQNYKMDKLKFLLEKYKMSFHQISAKQGHNIEKMFFCIIDMIVSMQEKKKKKFQEEKDIMPPLTTQNLQSDRQNEESKNVKISQQQHIEEPQQRRKWLCC